LFAEGAAPAEAGQEGKSPATWPDAVSGFAAVTDFQVFEAAAGERSQATVAGLGRALAFEPVNTGAAGALRPIWSVPTAVPAPFVWQPTSAVSQRPPVAVRRTSALIVRFMRSSHSCAPRERRFPYLSRELPEEVR
jgi:hypothetical protein